VLTGTHRAGLGRQARPAAMPPCPPISVLGTHGTSDQIVSSEPCSHSERREMHAMRA
jgi:hypothetical protein